MATNYKTQLKLLRKQKPCSKAYYYFASKKTAKEAWDDCVRGDWMLWGLGKLSGGPRSKSRKKLVLCACECARLALFHVPKGELRPLKAIETAELWASAVGKVKLQDVKKAADAADAAHAAYAAYKAIDADAVHAATYAATYAADAAIDATYAAQAAIDADAAYAIHAGNAKNKTLKICADIVRKHYPKPPVLKGE